MSMGKVICAGLGPGDPDLMSVRADRAIRGARHVAYFRKKGRAGQARTIVRDLLHPEAVEYPMEYPVTTELRFDSPEYRQLMVDFYADWADRLEELAREADVVVLCEGDPFFYGSFMYLYERLSGSFPCEIVPGVTSLTACAARLGRPLTARNDVLTVIPGPLSDEEISARIEAAGAIAIMKVGRHLQRLKKLISGLGLLGHAGYVERATLASEKAMPREKVNDAAAPYFSMILIYKGDEAWMLPPQSSS
jgi:precorrin-2/cobalt-factor-2 C20-methyltransferase